MSLPNWNQRGVLPDGIHSATLEEVYERFVLDAPNREDREVLFSTLVGYLGTLKTIVPHGKAWIDGGFAMNKDATPHDVDLVFMPSDWEALRAKDPATEALLASLLTLQQVFVTSPEMFLDRVQPYGGRIDAFICKPGQERYWLDTWSNVKRDGQLVPGESKGFVEVTW